MTLLLALLPVLVLMGGALLVFLPLPLSPRYRSLFSTVVCALSAVSLIIAATGPAAPQTLFAANEALPALSFTVQWNGAALPFGLFLLLVLGVRMFYRRALDSQSFVFGTLVSAAGILLFFASDNWTTVATAWVVVELGLLAIPSQEGDTREGAARAFGFNLVAIVTWLTAGMVIANEGGSLRLDEAALQGSSAFLVMLAVWLRTGLYPLHAAAPANADTIGWRMGVPLYLGGYLMIRLLLQTQGPMAFAAETQILAVLAVGASALVVVAQPHGGESFVWMLRAAGAALLLLPFFVDARAAPAIALWLTLGAFVLCVFVEVAGQWRAELPRVPLTMIVWLVVVFMIGALPLSPAFWGRVGLLSSAYAHPGAAMWLVLVATTSLALVPAWREVFASREVAPRAPTLTDYVTLVVLIAAALLVNGASAFFLASFGPPMQVSNTLVTDALLRPADFGALVFLLAGLFVPPLASFELARRWHRRANLLPTRASNWIDLTRFANALDGIYRFIRFLVQQCLALLEQPPIAWVLFLAIWIAVWLRSLSG
ncbi:MAG: hypothetical protein IT331_07010 [Anaerolineae bacterium]|nr:hypothetical protein [Anaerolineae bacterium]